MAKSALYKSQHAILTWLHGLGHRVVFSVNSRDVVHEGKRRGFVGRPCPYCGVAMTSHMEKKKLPSDVSRDHKLPRSRGGECRGDNRIIVCRSCNSRKGSRTLAEWHLALSASSDPRARHVAAVLEADLRKLDFRKITNCVVEYPNIVAEEPKT